MCFAYELTHRPSCIITYRAVLEIFHVCFVITLIRVLFEYNKQAAKLINQ